jgi:predicted ATPase
LQTTATTRRNFCSFLDQGACLKRVSGVPVCYGAFPLLVVREPSYTVFFLVFSLDFSGSGKKRLARSIKDRVNALGGYYLTGKFEQFGHMHGPESYAAFVAAFTEFAEMVLQRGESVVSSMRDAIRESGSIGEEEFVVLASMIPALENILGKSNEGQPTSTASFGSAVARSKAEATQRFALALRMFIRAVCSSKQPVVLLMDNLHYTDRCSLDLLDLILKDRELQSGLLLLGTCDDNVSPDQYLSRKLRDMEDSGPDAITNIPLCNLARDRVQCVLSDAFRLDDQQSHSLANVVHSQTNGNFFYMIEFLQWLQDSKRIVLDDKTEKWTWSENELCNATQVCCVEEFLSQHVMEQLPDTIQEVLKVAAGLGESGFNERFIEYALDIHSPVTPILEEAVNLGVLVYDPPNQRFDFKDDTVQAAAYRLIPEAEREEFHLNVARKLWKRLDLDELDRYIFVVLAQMHAGCRLITKDKEKVAVAKLCLHGGKKAAKSSTFRTASAYLELGISLLDKKRCWREEYELTLLLYNHSAEMSMCIADFDRSDSLVEDVFVHARIFEHKIQAYGTKIYSLGSRGLPQESLLKGKSDEQLLRIPLIENEQKLQALQILQLLILNALLVRPRFTPFVMLKCMKLTLKYGLSVMASGTFATYGMLCIAYLGDSGIAEATRFAKLALILLDRFDANEYLPRVYASVFGCIHSWTQPIGECLEPLLRAHRVGLRTGDIEFSALCAVQFCDLSFHSGEPLDLLIRHWKNFQDTITTSGRNVLRATLAHIQAIHHYMGVTDDPLSSKGDLFDYDDEIRRAREVGAINDCFCICLARMALAYVFNAYDLAAEHCVTVLRDVWLTPPCYDRVSSQFYASLVSLSIARKGTNFRKNIRVTKQILKRFKAWSTQSPHNCLGKKFLIEAELASVKGQNARAREKYYAAIAISRDSGGSFMRALSTERAARHFLTAGGGDTTVALPYFEQACKFYKEWGGLAKVSRLQQEIKALYPPEA